jgi:hypothetical protein
VITELRAVLRFVGGRADCGVGATFLREGEPEPDDWPPEFDQLNVLDPGTAHHDLSGLVNIGLLDIRDGLTELGLKMSFPGDGPQLEWAGHDDEARRVIDRAADLGSDVWRRFSAA